jgi:hypothetical protein
MRMSTRDEIRVSNLLDLLVRKALDAQAANGDVYWRELADADSAEVRAELLSLLAPPAPGEVTKAAHRVSSAAWTALDMRHGGGRIDEWDRHLKAAVEALDKALETAAAPEQS